MDTERQAPFVELKLNLYKVDGTFITAYSWRGAKQKAVDMGYEEDPEFIDECDE